MITKSKQKSEQIDNLQAELLKQKAKTDELISKNTVKRSRGTVHNLVLVLLRDTLKNEVWRVMKFISSKNQMRTLAIFTVKKSGLKDKFNQDGQLTPEGLDFVEKHEIRISKMLNEQRSSCQSAMKDVCLAYMKDKGVDKLPPQDEILKILRRDKDLDKDLFIWWWTEYMPKAAGSARVWTKQLYYFGRLCDHAPQNDKTKVYITPSTEAWGALLMDNCRKRWPKLMALKAKSSGKIMYCKNDNFDNKVGFKHVNVASDPDFAGKYTKVDLGQRKYGGWSKEGLKYYTTLVKMNKEARAKPATKVLEDEILKTIRTRHGITGSNWAEYKKQTSGSQAVIDVDDKVKGLFDMDDLGGIEAI